MVPLSALVSNPAHTETGENKTRRLAAGFPSVRKVLAQEGGCPASVTAIGSILRPIFGAVIGAVIFKELDQPVHQLPASSNYMKPTLVLVLFQKFVQSVFQFAHVRCPQSGFGKPPVITAHAASPCGVYPNFQFTNARRKCDIRNSDSGHQEISWLTSRRQPAGEQW